MDEKKIVVSDDLMAQIHTKQILNELRIRIPVSHFKAERVDSKFTQIMIKVPNLTWEEAVRYPTKKLEIIKQERGLD